MIVEPQVFLMETLLKSRKTHGSLGRDPRLEAASERVEQLRIAILQCLRKAGACKPDTGSGAKS